MFNLPVILTHVAAVVLSLQSSTTTVNAPATAVRTQTTPQGTNTQVKAPAGTTVNQTPAGATVTAPGTTAVGNKQGTNVNAPYTTVKTNNQNGEDQQPKLLLALCLRAAFQYICGRWCSSP